MRVRILRRCRNFDRLAPTETIPSALADRSGSVSVEFAFVAPMVILTILGIMSLGYLLLIGQMLDYATQKSAREIRTGHVQLNGLDRTSFRKTVVCSYLPVLFSCDDVIVNIQTVPTNGANHPNEYYNYVNSTSSGLNSPTLDNTTTSFCPGTQKNYVYLQILYPARLFQIFVYNALGTTVYKGDKVDAIMSTATFLNEPFGSAGTGC